MIELGVGFHPELTGRENVFLNAAIHGLSRSGNRSDLSRHRELFGARALHRRPDQELLVGHVHATGICDRGESRARHPAPRRDLRRRRRRLPAALRRRRSRGSWSRARPSCSCRTHPTPCGRSAAGRASSIRESWPSTAMSRTAWTSTNGCWRIQTRTVRGRDRSRRNGSATHSRAPPTSLKNVPSATSP